jgi:hypothetical protein
MWALYAELADLVIEFILCWWIRIIKGEDDTPAEQPPGTHPPE